MKKTTKKLISVSCVFGLLLALAACTKNFDKINTNPNAPTFVPTSYLLSCAQKGLMDFTWDRWWNASTGMILAQYYAENTYTSESQYFFRTNITKQYWGYFYGSGINDQGNAQVIVSGIKTLQTIINECSTSPSLYSPYGTINNQKAVSTILEVWEFQNLTDTWGDIPFSQALQDVSKPSPAFDKQSDIYNGLLGKLDSAIAWIDITKNDVQGDLIYGGQMAEWLKFANSLKLRLAIRIIDRNPTLASQKITEAINNPGGLFTSNADNALFTYISPSPPNDNPLHYDREVSGRTDFCASNTIIDVMNALNDGRLSAYFDPAAATGTFVGRPFGQNNSDAGNSTLDQWSQPSGAANGGASGTLSPTAPGIYMDYAQVEFILAEAAERGIAAAGDAQTHYLNAIKGSFNFWTGADPAGSYLSQAGVDYNAQKGAGMTYKQIIGKQKWLALYMQGIQGWVEWRRLDFGILNQPVDGYLVGSSIPVRMIYPYDESQLNPAGYNQAVSDQGADVMSTKVWWDVN